MKSLFIFSDSTGVGQLVSPHKTWVHLLSEYLGDDYLVQNASKNGDTTRGALERMHYDVLCHEPDLVYVQFGSNDANKWQTDRGLPRVLPDAFEQNLLSIIRRCRAFNAQVILANNHTGAYNREIGNVAHFANMVVDHSRYSVLHDARYILPDAVHLNELGHRLYFETIKAVF